MQTKHPAIAEKPVAATFAKYMSDGPSYSGDVAVRIVGSTVELWCLPHNQAATVQRLDITPALPEIAEVLPFGLEQLHSAFSLLPEDVADYYDNDPGNVAIDRFAAVVFSDQSQGAIFLGGEACFVSIVRIGKGHEMAYDLSFEGVPEEVVSP